MKHIRILVLILCACFVSVAFGQLPECKYSPFWGEFHKQNMQRWNRCEQVLNVKNVRNLSLKWSYATGGAVTSSPAVANGAVYVGSTDNNVYALNASTGTEMWSYNIGGGNNNYSSIGRRLPVRAERQHQHQAVELQHWQRRVLLARRSEWGSVYRLLSPQCGCAERQHRRLAVELHYRRGCRILLIRQKGLRAEGQDRRPAVELHHRLRNVFLARRVKWGAVCRLAGGWRVRLRPEVKARSGKGRLPRAHPEDLYASSTSNCSSRWRHRQARKLLRLRGTTVAIRT